MIPVVIRLAEAADLDAIRAVHRRAFAPLRALYRPGPAARSAGTTAAEVRLVALRQNRIQATACYTIVGDALEIFAFATDPDCQRQGLARALLERMEAIARQAGLARIQATVVSQTGNAAIYRCLGFAEISTAPSTIFISDLFPVIHETVMEKRLD